MSRAAWIFSACTLGLAVVAPVVASSAPDGLERVALDLGFADEATEPAAAPMPDYEVRGAGRLSGPLAGLIGAAAVGGVALGAGALLKRRP